LRQRFRQLNEHGRPLDLVRDVLHQIESSHRDAGELHPTGDLDGAIPHGSFGVDVLV
jgi:hypothetical protein